ncbi:MAG: ribonuclease HII [Alkalilacustris sp.]
MPHPAPDFSRETAARVRGAVRVAGVDEVGRGPLAGPVVAAAVVLNPEDIPEGLRDSKTLGRGARERLAAALLDRAEVAVAEASVAEIERVNILQAGFLAMTRALAALRPDLALIDGNRLPEGLACPAEAIIGGDRVALSIAAASIVAKVRRDAIMAQLARQHPGYGWERNAGYPTPEHRAALRSLGVTPHHRRGFAPVRNILCEDIGTTR